jgi:hypothetical protein
MAGCSLHSSCIVRWQSCCLLLLLLLLAALAILLSQLCRTTLQGNTPSTNFIFQPT